MTARPMTRAEALAEARRRWPRKCGLGAFAHSDALGCMVGPPSETWTDANGNTAHGARFTGAGPTWEAAFADADRRERAK